MTLAMGVIADDLTGATDLASAIAGRGLRTLIAVGADAQPNCDGLDAVVVALKSRSIPAPKAVEASLQAYRMLSQASAQCVYFKYCSTFDSTPAGNIGPVAEALLNAAGQGLMMHCPSFPATGRSVIGGELFVNGIPLAGSPMRNHPKNPMTDSDLVRVLGCQSKGRVGLVPLQVVRKGPAAVSKRLRALATEGMRHAIIDAVNHDDLSVAAKAAKDMHIAAGATGFGEALVTLKPSRSTYDDFTIPDSPTLVLAGSCSETTLGQLREASGRTEIYQMDVAAFGDGTDSAAAAALSWATAQLRTIGTAIISASTPAKERSSQAARGSLGASIEDTMGRIAVGAVGIGVRRFVVAGGETSGAVIQALEIDALTVGPTIDPGVPVVATTGDDPLALILKSGNFGRQDLLVDPFGRQLWRV